MVGQEHVLRALINALDNDRLHHAFLFTGTRGVGKTTIARILAKSLNCEQGVSSTPCGQCSACQEIDEGRFVDLIEVDAASRTKVEDTRELLDNVQYAPSRGRFKVYLIDEVHMLSNHSFNALLKTLEEPPPHIKFLLATTDPQKLPVTILSRCLQFNLRRLAAGQIEQHLAHILDAEKIDSETAALKQLARAAEGSMRDALSLLDQAIAFGGGSVKDADARAMLGTIEQRHIYELLHALEQRDAAKVLAIVHDLAEAAPDFSSVLTELSSALHYIAVLQQVPDAYNEAMGDKAELDAMAQNLSPEDVQLFYQIAVSGRRDLLLAPEPRSGLEMTLLRMLAFFRAEPAESGIPDVGKSQQESIAKRTPADKKTEKVTAPKPESVMEPVPVSQSTKKTVATESKQSEQDEWRKLLATLGLTGVVQQLAMHCALVKRDAQSLELALDPECAHLKTKERETRLQEALQAGNESTLRVQIVAGDGTIESPAALAKRLGNERQEQAEENIAQDNNVKTLMDTFDATVRPGSVRPTD